MTANPRIMKTVAATAGASTVAIPAAIVSVVTRGFKNGR
jgi:hypothetical protein